ncbi:hypothetical protein [Candidatus Parabeggiatoa sp. HSG14]|uniref:hypothetical protein n=1 Tax=Candidatus Parabeggiatoa sp. HSG14 TaxID=3055593 RepID=UPI0025A76127|nr:hypothetical protein [Thiotrichales bacterium HSG14]
MILKKVEETVRQDVILANNPSKRVTISISLEIAQLLTQISEDQLKTILGKIAVYEKHRKHKKSQGTGHSVQTLRQIRQEE